LTLGPVLGNIGLSVSNSEFRIGISWCGLACSLLLVALGCNSGRKNGITLAGSTSVEPFAERLAEVYMGRHKGLAINVQGGGSSAGIRAVSSGICQIGMSSRDLTQEETGLTEIPIALDGIVLIVNRQNPVRNLTREQAREVFSGRIRNWSKVGGSKRRITVITREEGSGTRASFEQRVMAAGEGRDATFARDALVQDSNGAVREIVASDPDAIGYISFGLVDDRVHALALDGVAPAESTIKTGTYPVVRKFLFLTRPAIPSGRPETDSASQRFIQYTLSSEGQRILVEEGLVSIVR
jgi:phosphate transport system substrate-binding protein